MEKSCRKRRRRGSDCSRFSTPYTPDPTSDHTPTYSASAGNAPFPPGGCNTLGGICYRQPSPVTISKVKRAQWRLDSGSWTSNGLSPTDGAFNEEFGETYRFTPTSPVPAGTHTFRTRSINNFGHKSTVKKDTLTIQSTVSFCPSTVKSRKVRFVAGTQVKER